MGTYKWDLRPCTPPWSKTLSITPLFCMLMSYSLIMPMRYSLISFNHASFRFVPNITIGPLIVEAIRPTTNKVLDCHLVSWANAD